MQWQKTPKHYTCYGVLNFSVYIRVCIMCTVSPLILVCLWSIGLFMFISLCFYFWSLRDSRYVVCFCRCWLVVLYSVLHNAWQRCSAQLHFEVFDRPSATTWLLVTALSGLLASADGSLFVGLDSCPVCAISERSDNPLIFRSRTKKKRGSSSTVVRSSFTCCHLIKHQYS